MASTAVRYPSVSVIANHPQSAYVAQSPVFHFDKKEKVFVGGNFWDGRATGKRLKNPAAEQAQGPFLNPLEHGFTDAACVVNRVCTAPYGGPLEQALARQLRHRLAGRHHQRLWRRQLQSRIAAAERAKVDLAYDRIALAIAAFEGSAEVNPFSSRFDAWRAGKGTLTRQEQLGFKLFNKKGKCAEVPHCLKAKNRSLPTLPTTTWGFPAIRATPSMSKKPITLRVPPGQIRAWGGSWQRKRAIRPRPEAHFGAHKVPTLRNVDKRPSADFAKVYGHNGYFKSLKEIVHFYNTRDILPVCNPGDKGERVSCWPLPETAMNMNSKEMGNLRLSDAEEEAIVAFMKTLTDG